jgi:hypothetical protein
MQCRKVFARTSEGELNRSAGGQMGGVYAVPALADAIYYRGH